jgi:hypothetical protein
MLAQDRRTHLHLHSSRDSRKELAPAPAPAAGNDDALTVMCQPTPSFSIGRRAVESDVAGTENKSQPEWSSFLIYIAIFIVSIISQ